MGACIGPPSTRSKNRHGRVPSRNPTTITTKELSPEKEGVSKTRAINEANNIENVEPNANPAPPSRSLNEGTGQQEYPHNLDKDVEGPASVAVCPMKIPSLDSTSF
jgi:hypothetical protein